MTNHLIDFAVSALGTFVGFWLAFEFEKRAKKGAK